MLFQLRRIREATLLCNFPNVNQCLALLEKEALKVSQSENRGSVRAKVPSLSLMTSSEKMRHVLLCTTIC